MAETDSLQEVADSQTPFSTWLGIILLFVVFGAIVLAFVGPSPRIDNYEASRAKKRSDSLATLRTEDAKTLSSYAYVDKAKGSVRIPIERAMELTVTEMKDKKPSQGSAIVATPAAPAAAPSAAPSAAPKSGATPVSPAQVPQSQTSSNTAATPAPHANEPEGPRSEIRSQPAGAANPPNPKAGAAAIPNPSPAAVGARPAVTPTGTPNQKSSSPLPVPGVTPTP